MTIGDDIIINILRKGVFNLMFKGEDLTELNSAMNKEDYLSALRKFTRMTISNPSFFDKNPEEQKNIALETIREQKKANK